VRTKGHLQRKALLEHAAQVRPGRGLLDSCWRADSPSLIGDGKRLIHLWPPWERLQPASGSWLRAHRGRRKVKRRPARG